MAAFRVRPTRLLVLLCAFVAALPGAAGATSSEGSVPPLGLLPVPVAGLALVACARLSRESALRDPVRRALKEAAEGVRGGVTASQAAALASASLGIELDRKAAESYLSQLTRRHILRSQKAGGRRVYLAIHAPEPPPTEPLGARILAFVRDNPGVSAASAAEQLGVTDTRFDRHLKDLIQRGLLTRWRPSGAPGFLLCAVGGLDPPRPRSVRLEFARL